MMVAFGLKWLTSLASMPLAARSMAALSILFIGFDMVGCKRRENLPSPSSPPPPPAPVLEKVYTNRNNNAAYISSLKGNFRQQLAKAAVRRAAEEEMAAYREKAKAGLPAGADAAAVERALETDEAWAKLKAQYEAAVTAEESVVQEATAKVRQAMLEEMKARKDVADGHAEALDGQKVK